MNVGMAKHFSKKYGNKGWAFTTWNPKFMSRYLSAPDATSLPQDQAAKTNMVFVVRIQVFSIIHSRGGCG